MTYETKEISQLDKVLEEERTLLLQGDLGALGTLLPVKEQLVELFLENSKTNREQIAPLESKLRRNQLLLDGALDGIRAVTVRLAALRQVHTALDTYDAQGQKQHATISTNTKVEKRA